MLSHLQTASTMGVENGESKDYFVCITDLNAVLLMGI